MKPTPRQYALLLRELEAEFPAKSGEIAERLLSYLKRTRSLAKLPAIVAEYERTELIEAGAMRLTIASARNLAPDEKKALTRLGEELFGKPAADVGGIVAPELLGGVVLSTGEERLDGSVRKSLQALRLAVTQQ
jgi:F-type H+-transporting ATPase subunit delta